MLAIAAQRAGSTPIGSESRDATMRHAPGGDSFGHGGARRLLFCFSRGRSCLVSSDMLLHSFGH